jgi:tetratricopeptide (TPR) repeat protein
MSRTIAALLTCLCVVAAPATAWARWTRVASEHFVFIGDVPDRDMRDIAQRLEEFREVVSRVYSEGATASPVPTTVIVFQNDRSFMPFKPVFQGKPVAVAGYFTPGEDTNYIAVNVEQGAAAYPVVFHEYAHFLLGNAIGNAPVWVNEGLASFYQTFQAGNGGKSAMLGMPDSGNLRLLQASPTLLPIADLIAVDHDSPMYNEGDRRGLFYAESWALVHYLTFGTSRPGQLKTYLSSIAQGTPGPEAFQRAFGSDDAALERELRGYIRSVGLNALRVVFDDKVSATTMSPGQVIPDDEAAGYLGDMLARLNRADDARAYLHRIIEGNAEAARAIMALGLLELRATNMEVAYPLLEKAASLAPGVASIQSAYGRVLAMRAGRGALDEEALYAKARTVLARALELEPGNASTLVTLAEVEMGSGANPARAVALMQQALKAAPGREEYRLMLAEALAMNGDYRIAANYLGLLIARGSRPEIRDAARKTLTRVATAENAVLSLADPDPAEPDPADPSASANRRSPAGASMPEPPRETAPQGLFVPTLRSVLAGEARVLGTFAAADCRPGAIVLQVDTAAGPVRLAVKTFGDVEFITYRQDSPDSVACGPQRPAYRVLATFRTDAPVAGANTPNRAVAIELLPDGYTPK